MKKIILIGEFSLNTVVGAEGKPLGIMPGGRIAHAAALIARAGLPARIVGDASADTGGDIATSFLSDAGVDTTYLDRYTDGLTPMMVHFPYATQESGKVIRYEKYPPERFDVAWPRIDPGDIVVFGGYESIDPSVRGRLLPLLQTAAEHHAIMVYLPGFLPSRAPRITRVMPSILENLEISSFVVTSSPHRRHIFGEGSASDIFSRNVSFYSPAMLDIDVDTCTLSLHARGIKASVKTRGECDSTLWIAGALAGAVRWIFDNVTSGEDFQSLKPSDCDSILDISSSLGHEATAGSQPWQLSF